ncbi:hypothetical protein [Roseisolibacter sp. H3M3-2]|uniref:hypothetical protein n=1 Tax=Roseisolibacter sp. H3M3-2 TaxID=3031323 RepID=UPI0023DBB02D|nr:hypothetical protein [Roseisolibacter sp. H3M3-2]MDF1501881.1 hypothetical protein [Roseisolibacter sp. H3M3-2]
MERNPNDSLAGTPSVGTGRNAGGTGASALGTGTDSISVTGTGLGQNASTGGMGGTTGGDVGDLDLGRVDAGGGAASMGDRLGSARDTATEKLGQARDVAGERLGQAKEKATQLKATLADKLEAGANSLRPSQGGMGGEMQFAGANGSTATAETNPQLQQLRSTGADVMQKTAEFLRTGDLRGTVEEQMRTNPGRTLLIAVGLGYVLGKAIRGGDRR